MGNSLTFKEFIKPKMEDVKIILKKNYFLLFLAGFLCFFPFEKSGLVSAYTRGLASVLLSQWAGERQCRNVVKPTNRGQM